MGEDHPTKSVATASLLVTCAVPSAITLIVDEPGASQIFTSPLVIAGTLSSALFRFEIIPKLSSLKIPG